VADRRRFRPSLVVTIATIAFCALTVSLGVWQTHRAQHKEAMQARVDRLAAEPPMIVPAVIVKSDSVAQRHVAARGEYAHRYTILLDNKVHRGRVGYQVVSPLRIGASDIHVLVNRGWIAAGRTRADLPQAPALAGERMIEGIAVIPSAQVFELQAETSQGPVWQNLVLDRYRAWSGLQLQPFVIQQTSETDDGLIRDWARPDTGADRNRAYAVQWFSLAVLAFVLYVALKFQSPQQ
jgi:surfeit locus 1 family protein